MDDFKILLQAEIDKAKSKGQIDSDISSLGNQIDKLKIQVDTSNITKSIQKAIKDAFNGFKMPTLNSGLLTSTSQYKSEYQQLVKLAKQMGSLQFKLTGLDTSKNESEISTLTQQLNQFKSEYDSLMNSVSGNLSTTQLNNLQTVIDGTNNKIDVLNAKLADTKAKTSEGIQYKIDIGDYETDIVRIQAQFEKWGMSAKDVETHMSSLKTAYNNLINPSNADQRIENEQKYQQELQKTKNEITQMSVTTASTFDKQNLSNKIKTWLEQNTAASKEAQIQLQSYLAELEDADLAAISLKKIKQGLEDIIIKQRAAGNLGKSWSDTLKAGVQKFVEWGAAAGATTKVFQTVKDMYQAVYDIDTEMTELAKVSDATASQLSGALEEATKTAKTYGATVSDVVSATADWSRLGYSLEDSEKLAEIATIYKNVGDGIDIDTANTSLVSTLQGFQLSTEEALHIIDAFNEVANTEAIDSAGIGEALQRSASSMYAAGNTLEETIGLVTAAKLYWLKNMETYFYRTHLNALIA